MSNSLRNRLCFWNVLDKDFDTEKTVSGTFLKKETNLPERERHIKSYLVRASVGGVAVCNS